MGKHRTTFVRASLELKYKETTFIELEKFYKLNEN